ncbi:MAG TPA: ribulose-phosphate 3-epimerase [Bacillota bacterium]|nr:ribulose-phosphate 3-epimerase [Bacillota bacterium]HOK68876.1 ribulose-phosphate 3-epimerase [Bacillota bacterium]HPP85673.1 ribulose-phosphate 3-epimerase [Bacillota bacterium]
MNNPHKKIILAPSLLSCDFANIGKQLSIIREAGAQYLHLDVMDGVFVPNISFGQPLIKSLRQNCDLIFDVHLMIVQPERYIDDFVAAGADIITIHAESTEKCRETLSYIRSKGIKSAVSVKPKTPVSAVFGLLDCCDMVLIMSVEPGFGGQKFMPDMLEKAKELKAEIARRNLNIDIEMDGGIDASNARRCVEAGVNILVAGSSVFGKPDIAAAVKSILNAAEGNA